MISRLALLVALVALGVASLALFVATRSDDSGTDGESSDAEAAAEAAEADSRAAPAVEPSNGAPATSASQPAPSSAADTTEAPPVPAAELPGAPFDFGPSAGAVLHVVGVSHDDALNLRDAPFGEVIATLSNEMWPDGSLLTVRAVPSGETIAQIDMRADGVVASGSSRRLPTTTWHEVEVGGVRGWASADYLAPLGATYDMTGEVVETAGATPTARTMTELATTVVDALTSGGEEPPEVAVASAPGVFSGLWETAVDVLGLADDSLRGYRLHISADPGDGAQQDDPGLFTLRSVTARWICDSYRGTTHEGLCR